MTSAFRRLWGAHAASCLGDGLYLAALPLLAAVLSRDPVAVSLVVAAGWLPWLLFGLVSGALADRWPRLRVMVAVDLLRAAVVAALGLAVLLDIATIALLAAGAFVLGTAQTLFDSAAQAALPVVVGHDTDGLAMANSRFAGAQTVGRELAGPPLGSALFPVAPFLPFLVDALSFLVSAVLVGGIPRDEPPGGPRPHVGAEILAGLRWIRGHRVILAMAGVVGLSNLAWVGAEAVLVLLAQERLGLDVALFGLLLAAPALGALPGALVAGWVARRVPPGPVLIGGLVAQAGVLLGVGLVTDAVAAGVLLALGGLLTTVWNVTQVVQRQLIVPDELTGRVVSATRVVAYGAAPVGALLGGLLAAAAGLPAPFVAGAGVLLLAAMVAVPFLNSAALAGARPS